MNEVKKSYRLCWILLLIFSAAFAVLQIGHHGTRIADTHTDNGIVNYVNLERFPERFVDDEITTYAPHSVAGTIVFWLPVMLNKYFNVPPEPIDYLVFFLQLFLIAPAFFKLSLLFTNNLKTSFATAILSCLLLPWGWNLAVYPAITHMAFYTSLVIPVIVFQLVYFLEQKLGKLLWITILGALIHPAIHLYMVTLFFALVFFPSFRAKRFKILLISIGTALIAILPSLTNLNSITEKASFEDHWIAISKHMHFYPWREFSFLWNIFWPTFLCFSIISLVAYFSQRQTMSRPYKELIQATWLTTAFFVLIHFIGINTKILPLIQLTGLRATMLISIVMFPVVINYFSLRLLKFSAASLSAALVLLYMLYSGTNTFGFGLFVPLIASLLLTEALSFKKWNSKVIFIIALLINTSVYFTLGEKWAFIGSSFTPTTFLYLILTGLVLIFIYKSKWTQNILTLLLISYTLFIAFENSKRTDKGQLTRSLYDAQVWARDNTAEDARFITSENWRSVSQRHKINPTPYLNTKIYAPVLKLVKHESYFLELYNLSSQYKDLPYSDLFGVFNTKFNELSKEDFKKIANDLGANYVVKRSNSLALDLPMAYKNEHFIIYRIDKQ